MKKFTFSIMTNEIFYPKVTGKKIIWSNSFKSFKDTISKTNTCFRQHHDFPKETFQRKRFRNSDWKHENHTTWQNSWSYVTIRELQARKHNQFSVTNTSFAKDKIQKKRTLHDIKTEILELSWNKNPFQKLLNLWKKKPKGRKISKKLSRKRWQVINFSPLSFQTSSKNVLELKLFNRFLHLIFWNQHLVSKFEHSN